MKNIAIVVALLAGLGLGCAGPRMRVRDLTSNARELFANAPAEYGPTSVAPVSRGETDRLRARYEGQLEPAMRPLLRRDPALDLAAAVVAEMASDTSEHTAVATSAWTLWRAGALGTNCHLDAQFAIGRREDMRAGQLDLFASQWARNGGIGIPSTYGLARFSEGRVTSQALVRCEAPIEVDPFPKRYAAGAPLTIRFKPLDGSSHFVFLADTDGPAIAESALHPNEDGSYTIEHTVPKTPGRYFVEVRALYAPTAHGMPAPHSVLWVPIYVDVPEPAAPDAFMRAAPVPAGSDESFLLRLTARVNDERRKAGLGPATVDPRLAKLANARVALRAKHEGYDGGAHEKLPGFVKGGDSVWDYVEVSGGAESPEEHLELLLLQPSVKRTIRAPKLLIGLDARAEAISGNALPMEQVAGFLWAEGASPPPGPEFKVEAQKEITRSPGAEQFYVVPLRVFLMQSSRVPALSTGPALEAQIRPRVEKLNRVWSAAGVYFRLDAASPVGADVDRVAADLEKLPPASRAAPPNRLVANAIPSATRTGPGFRLYFVHDFDLNGVFIGRGEVLVKETATSAPVAGGLDDSVSRTMAHELGHGLGLSHRQDRVNLMAWGTLGIRITEAEGNRARGVARTVPGAETFAQAKARGESAVVTAIEALADKDVTRFAP